MPVYVEHDGGIVTAWLDNASKRNAMDDSMLAALSSLLEGNSEGGAARVIVIRGRNECFCSGRDLGAIGSSVTGPEATPAERLAPVNRLAAAFRAYEVPVVALVEGKAAGLGVSLACWADIAIASAEATFCIPEARSGIAPSVTAVSLIEAIGRRRALDLCLTGRSVDATVALQWGLVQYLAPSGDAAAMLQDVLDMLQKGAPEALRLTKELSRSAEGLDFDGALAAAGATAGRSLAGAEVAEGLRALREKRRPAWQHASPLGPIAPDNPR